MNKFRLRKHWLRFGILQIAVQIPVMLTCFGIALYAFEYVRALPLHQPVRFCLEAFAALGPAWLGYQIAERILRHTEAWAWGSPATRRPH